MNFSLPTENGSLLEYFSNASDHTNLTSPEYTAQWTTMAITRLVLTLTSLFPNAALLAVFLTQQHLRQSAFNIYLMNLLTCNVVYGIIQKPPDILNDLYPHGWPFGSAYCTVYIYFTWVLESGMRNCHGLITLNRLWAVLWPNSYRTRHSRRIAISSVIGSWICIHVILLPGLIQDALYYRLPLATNQCWPNLAAQRIWSEVASIMAYDLFQVVIVLAFPVIYYRRYRYLKGKISDHTPADSRGQKGHATKSDEGAENGSKRADRSVAKADKSAGKPGHVRSTRKLQNGAYTVLMVLTASVTICWTPPMVYYLILDSAPGTYMPPLLDRVILILLSLQTTLDPLLFVVAMPDFRRAIILLFKKADV